VAFLYGSGLQTLWYLVLVLLVRRRIGEPPLLRAFLPLLIRDDDELGCWDLVEHHPAVVLRLGCTGADLSRYLPCFPQPLCLALSLPIPQTLTQFPLTLRATVWCKPAVPVAIAQ